ncbi:TlpA family protein disulfide reductase [Neokomagataea anthophila]|uniref:TlpA family protein disulfide reductase n=1 Tax=Neokomagataea anthophila TaxID=2826925 RepID=A0ABS5E6L3_9PROT|nr:TlpA disulfide reductase family protein [Neokomagataea anthophila]MBR0559441.1 TlpA family protein disulfide reductase [Neokomagataea anthophila]
MSSNPINRRSFWGGLASLGVTAVLTLAVLGGGRLTGAAHAEQQDLPSPVQSLVAGAPSRDPIALSLSGPDGHQLALESYRGKPFLLHVWATWCGPCKQELPKLNGFLVKNPNAPIVPVAIASGDAAKVATFLTQGQDTAISAWVVDKAAFKAWYHAPSLEIPVTLLIDEQGHVRAISDGGLDWGAADAATQLSKVLAHVQ